MVVYPFASLLTGLLVSFPLIFEFLDRASKRFVYIDKYVKTLISERADAHRKPSDKRSYYELFKEKHEKEERLSDLWMDYFIRLRGMLVSIGIAILLSTIGAFLEFYNRFQNAQTVIFYLILVSLIVFSYYFFRMLWTYLFRFEHKTEL